jgi:tRNA C32,U32 (ribose-2'-O)-methylase TrmJ
MKSLREIFEDKINVRQIGISSYEYVITPSDWNSIFDTIENNEAQLAELQHLCLRTLEILNDEKFFDKTMDKDGFWHSSLEKDLIKASNGKEFRMFLELMKRSPKKNSNENNTQNRS